MARVELEGPDRDAKLPNTGLVSKENGWSFRKVLAELNTMLTELYAGIAGAEAFTVTAATVTADRPVVFPTYTVATLPDAVAGGVIYVSDGAAGSPILAFSDGVNWLRSDTAAAVAAA